MRDRATILARVEASALIDEWLDDAPDALSRSLPTMRAAANLAGDTRMDPLADAIESRDRQRILNTLAALAGEIGVKRIGGDPNLGPGQVVTFDRRLHRSIGEPLRPGQKVAIVSPGYTATGPDGAEAVLVQADVEEASPEEIQRASIPEPSRSATDAPAFQLAPA